MLHNKIGPVFNIEKCVSVVVVFWRSTSFYRENEICNNKNLGPIFNVKKKNISWTNFNFTAYFYAVESKIGPILPFWIKIGPFFLFCFQKSSSSGQGKCDFTPPPPTKTKLTIFWVKNWSNYVAQQIWTNFWLKLGPILDSTFLTCLAIFLFHQEKRILVTHPTR